MGENESTGNVMLRIAAFIVNKRKAVLVIFAVACIFCLTTISKVGVENDLTEYLADSTETKQGLDLMDSEFITLGTGKILVSNITYERALALASELEDIKGISAVSFYDPDDDSYDEEDLPDYYKDAAALFTLTFEEEEDTDLSQTAIAKVRERLKDYNAYVYTTVDKDDAANLMEDMKLIAVIVVIIILLVLLFTSKTYMEIVIFLIVFGAAAILNMGTNFWFGTISFISNAVGAILQLALAIDYAIILFHRFMEERAQMETREAITVALSKAIVEISSSSLTTISGMVAMMFMQYKIGMDLGSVLMKAIIFSMISVFLLMPALVVMFSDLIDKTAHRNFVPSIRIWGKLVVKIRFITLPIFVVVTIAAAIWSARCHYIYDVNSIESAKKNEYITSRDRIAETFKKTNSMALIVPKEDYQKEAQLIADLEKLDAVDTVTGLANIEVDDDGDHILVDKLNSREFSGVADMDLDSVRVLYRVYAFDKRQYSAFIKNIDDYEIPIIDMIDFIYDEKETGAFDLDDDKASDIDDFYDTICKAREQLEGDSYSRIIFTLEGDVEGEETFHTIDEIRDLSHQYYDETYVIGDPTSNYDLSNSFQKDNTMISILSALFVGIVLLFTFQSASLPFLLVTVIQSSIFINFSIPYLTDSTMFFLCYLILSAIQMGATIDYAIVVTNRYVTLRKELPDKKEAIVVSLDQAFPTIITSGTILTCAGFSIGNFTENATIASLGFSLGTGTLISIILVMTVLPQILLVFDKLIEKTGFSKEVQNHE